LLVWPVAVLAFYEGACLNVSGAQARQTNRRDIPRFEVDPSWPTIPNGWIFGWVSSASVDNQDHVWVLQRPGTLRPEEKTKAAPPLLEFDAAGKFIQSLGGPRAGYDRPGKGNWRYFHPKK